MDGTALKLTALVADSAILGDREGVATALERLRTVLNPMRDEPELAERSALHRSQRCKSG